jgi:hypothetical protein
LIDINLAAEAVDELAAVLRKKRLPFAFASGYGPKGLPQGFQETAILRKPFNLVRLLPVIQRLVGQETRVSPLLPLRAKKMRLT